MPQTLEPEKIPKRSSHPQSNQHAVEAIYQSNGRELWALLYAYCGDRERASDAVQEAFLRLQQQNVDEIKNPRGWLVYVGRNWLRDVARKKSCHSMTQPQLGAVIDGAESPEDFLARSEARPVVRKALLELRELDRQVLVLRYGLKWSAVQIAKALDSTDEAIAMRISRARRQLREILFEQAPSLADAEF
jgi:RNA polymerase sigma factor (sigma-70 family)